MLAVESLHDLVRNTKTNRALAGALLPANNNASLLELESVSSLTVVEDDPATGATPIAIGVWNTYALSQAYCAVVKTNAKYDGKFVNIEQVKTKEGALGVDAEHANRHVVYRIVNVRDTLPDLGSYPQYYRAFAEPAGRPLHQAIVDELIERTVGAANFELKRNVSVDVYDSDSSVAEGTDELWRDHSGFVVGDKQRFAEFEVEKSKLLKVMSTTAGDAAATITMKPLNGSSQELFVDYDQSLSVIDREAYLSYLFSLADIRGTVALDESKQPVGYVLSLNQRILACYGDSVAIASALLVEHVRGLDIKNVSLFMAALDGAPFEALGQVAHLQRRVRRFHSRIVPSNVKFQNCLVSGVGLHIF